VILISQDRTVFWLRHYPRSAWADLLTSLTSSTVLYLTSVHNTYVSDQENAYFYGTWVPITAFAKPHNWTSWLQTLFTATFRLALGPIQPPLQWVSGIKRPESEADHLPPSSTEIKNAWSYISTRPYVFMAWCLVKHRGNFTLYVLFHVRGFIP